MSNMAGTKKARAIIGGASRIVGFTGLEVDPGRGV